MAANENRLDEVDPSTIPEVIELINAREELDNFEAQYPDIFDLHHQLAEEYNIKLDAADKAVRSRGVTCDNIVKYQVQEKANAEVLYEWAGKEEFVRKGGKVRNKRVLELDKAQVKSHIASGEIPPEIAEQIFTPAPRYHTPKPR